MSRHWKQVWPAVIVLGAATLLVAVLGLFVFMSATATPLHPAAAEVPSSAASIPAGPRAAAVARARTLALAHLVDRNLPGLSVAVGVDGELVWAEGFGWANLESRAPVEPDTRFEIGTVSTALTSAAVGLLVEDGRLALDQEIQTWVPAYPRQPSPVTLRQLMAHVAGVRDDAGDEEPLSVRCQRPTDALPRFADRPLLFDPGTRFRFSSYGWVLVGAAVERAAGAPFMSFMAARVFEPLGMADTRADVATGPIPDVATFYFPRFAADPRYGPQPPRPIDLSCLAGASGLLSTPTDLVRFAMGLEAGRLLRPATVITLRTSHRLPSGQETGYGLGWDLETVTLAGEPARWVGHDGDVMDGRVASLMTFPDHGIVVAVTSNTAFADTSDLTVRVAEAFVVADQPAVAPRR